MSNLPIKTCSTCGHVEGSGDPHCENCYLFNAWESREEMNARLGIGVSKPIHNYKIETVIRESAKGTILNLPLKETCGISIPRLQLVPDFHKVIFNDPATIVYWADGTKTVVKCGEHDIYDPEKGLAMTISKKALGNQGNYYNKFKKELPEGEWFNDTIIDRKDIQDAYSEAVKIRDGHDGNIETILGILDRILNN